MSDDVDHATELLGPETEFVEPTSIRTAPKCTGFKKDGSPCGMLAIAGHKFCRWHGGVSKAMAKEDAKEQGGSGSVELRPYPFHDGSANENAAIRVIRMVKPNCPRESNPEIMGRDGTSRPNPRYTGEPSCERVHRINSQGRWDVEKCIGLGHDPYYTYFRKTILEETVGSDGYVSETKQRIAKEKRLNIIHVSDNIRHSTGMEVQLAVARGCRFLQDPDTGERFVCTCSLWPNPHHHEVPCEFRNCTQPQRVDTRYGKYCSERHARLIAADKQKKILPVGGDPYSQDQAMTEREDILGNLNIRKGA